MRTPLLIVIIGLLASACGGGNNAGSYDRCKDEVGDINTAVEQLVDEPLDDEFLDSASFCSSLFGSYDRNDDAKLNEIECDAMRSNIVDDLLSGDVEDWPDVDTVVLVGLLSERICDDRDDSYVARGTPTVTAVPTATRPATPVVTPVPASVPAKTPNLPSSQGAVPTEPTSISAELGPQAVHPTLPQGETISGGSFVTEVRLGPLASEFVSFTGSDVLPNVPCVLGAKHFTWSVRSPYPGVEPGVEFFNEQMGVHDSIGIGLTGSGSTGACSPVSMVNRTNDEVLMEIRVIYSIRE